MPTPASQRFQSTPEGYSLTAPSMATAEFAPNVRAIAPLASITTVVPTQLAPLFPPVSRSQ